jgi:hypothetical protein
MADSRTRHLTIYVQSKRAVTAFYRPPRGPSVLAPDSVAAGGSTISGGGPPSEEPTPTEAVYFLSDDQARALAHAEDLAAKRGYQLEVVDVGKAGRLEQFVTEHLRNVQTFPVMVDANGRRLEGPAQFTEEHLCELMPTEFKGIRAFTYIKVRGGNLDRIRDQLLTFNEVQELHLLTGDWDVFVVLSFPGDAKKRQVFDFVTERIRAVPDVLDTSTLVPEYTVTKFPV